MATDHAGRSWYAEAARAASSRCGPDTLRPRREEARGYEEPRAALPAVAGYLEAHRRQERDAFVGSFIQSSGMLTIRVLPPTVTV
jgi:hypothetical protein